MRRTLIIRCALNSSKLSATFGGYATIVGGIISYLALGKGRKSCKIVEISACLVASISGILTRL